MRAIYKPGDVVVKRNTPAEQWGGALIEILEVKIIRNLSLSAFGSCGFTFSAKGRCCCGRIWADKPVHLRCCKHCMSVHSQGMRLRNAGKPTQAFLQPTVDYNKFTHCISECVFLCYFPTRVCTFSLPPKERSPSCALPYISAIHSHSFHSSSVHGPVTSRRKTRRVHGF